MGELLGRPERGSKWPLPFLYPPGRRGRHLEAAALQRWLNKARSLLNPACGPLVSKDAVLTAERLPCGLTEVGGMDHCQPSPAEGGQPMSLHVSLQGRGSSGHFRGEGACSETGHCRPGPQHGREALQGPRAQAWSQREVGGAPQAAAPPSPRGPPSLAQDPKPSTLRCPVFSGAAPLRSPGMMLGPPGTGGPHLTCFP